MFEHINVKKYIDLDINQYNDMVLWNVQQGDHRTRVLEFNITNSGLNYIVPKGTFAQITWVKPDNTMIIEDSATQNSDLTTEKTDSSTIVTYKLSDNAVAVQGICEFKIKLLLYTDDGKGGYTTEVLSTVKGKIRVNKDVVNNDTIISTTEYKSAENIIGEGRDMLDNYYNVAEKIENKVSECNNAISSISKTKEECITATNECKNTTNECKKVIASAGIVKTVNGKKPDSSGNIEIETGSSGSAIDDSISETDTTWSSQHINEIQPKKLREEIEATCFKVEDEKDIHITVPSVTWLSNSNMIRITSYPSSLGSISLEKNFGLNIYVYVEGKSTFYTRYYIPKDNISALITFPITTVMKILWLAIYQGEDDEYYMTYDRIRDYTATNVQPDWNETDTSSDAYIKNKPVIPEAVTEATTSKHGLIPALSGNSEQYLNGNGKWVTPASSGGGTPSIYQQKITKTNAKTPFELTQSNVDWSRTNFAYYGGDSSNQPSLTVYLASGVTFDPNTQYITSCTDSIFSTNNYDTIASNSTGSDWNYPNTYGGFYLYLFSNDGTEITRWNSDSGKSSNIATTYESAQNLLSYIEGYYFVKNSSSTYIASALSEIAGDYLIGNTDVLIPYAGGYLYEDSEGGDIDFLLSCANNNNALSTRMYKFGVTTNMYAGTYQDISLKTNTKYKFSACVKVVSGTVTNIGLNITNSNSSSSGIGGAKELTITNGKVSYEFVTGSDLTNFKRFYVYNGKTNQTTSRQVLLYNMIIKEI